VLSDGATRARLVQRAIVLLAVQVLDVAIVARVLFELLLLFFVKLARVKSYTYLANCAVAHHAIAPGAAAGLVGTNMLLRYVEITILGCWHLLYMIGSAARTPATVALHLVDACAGRAYHRAAEVPTLPVGARRGRQV
jgi:hypothetical protein